MQFRKIFSGVLTIIILSSILGTFASARSSAYLNSYAATITPKSGGKLIITADAAGVGTMDQLGISTVYLYESTDRTSFHRVATYESDDYPQMIQYNTSDFFEDVATYYGIPGRYYYASVYVYAAKGSGSDEKNYTTSIVKAIS